MLQKQLPIILIFIAAFSWASAGVFIKLLPQYGVFEILSLRFLISSIILTLFLILNNRLISVVKELKNKNIWILIIHLLGCYYFGTLAFTLAPIGETSLLMAVSPLFVFLYNNLFQQEKIYKKEIIGFILAVIGIFIFLYLKQDNNEITQLYGNISAILVGVLFASYSILHKNKKYSSFSSLSVSYGMFILMIVPAIYYSNNIINNTSLLSQEMLYIILIGIISTVIPTLSIIYVAQNLSAMATSSVFILEIFFGFLLGYLLFDEILSVFLMFILGLILIGTILMVFKKKTI